MPRAAYTMYMMYADSFSTHPAGPGQGELALVRIVRRQEI